MGLGGHRVSHPRAHDVTALVAIGRCACRGQAYNEKDTLYSGAMAMSYVMKVSRNGQVSIPAEARARWGAERVVVVDLGDRIVLRPVTPGGVDDLVGKYAGTGPSTDALRAAERRDEARRERGR